MIPSCRRLFTGVATCAALTLGGVAMAQGVFVPMPGSAPAATGPNAVNPSAAASSVDPSASNPSAAPSAVTILERSQPKCDAFDLRPTVLRTSSNEHPDRA